MWINDLEKRSEFRGEKNKRKKYWNHKKSQKEKEKSKVSDQK